MAALKEFGVIVHAIEAMEPQYWEVPDLPDRLHQLLIGDCRQPKVLEQVGIQQCRAVLLVTSDE